MNDTPRPWRPIGEELAEIARERDEAREELRRMRSVLRALSSWTLDLANGASMPIADELGNCLKHPTIGWLKCHTTGPCRDRLFEDFLAHKEKK